MCSPKAASCAPATRASPPISSATATPSSPGRRPDAMSLAQSYEQAFTARHRPGEPAWLAERRRRALDSFRRRGFPSRREEAWRFSDLAPLTDTPFLPAIGAAASPAAAALAAAHRIDGTTNLVLVNGALSTDLSDPLPPGVATLAGSPE